MSDFKKPANRDYSKFDNMSTEALNEILRQDSQLPNNEESDMDAILYIMEVIAKREAVQSTNKFTDVDTAWKVFNEKYRPTAGDGKSLYDYDEERKEVYTSGTEVIPFKSKSCKTPNKKHGIFRVAVVAAAVLTIIFAGSMTAYAFGFDLWGAVATWTKEAFGFERVEAVTPQSSQRSIEKEIPDQLKELERVLSEHGVINSVLPSYLPEGYEVIDVQYNRAITSTDFVCLLEKGDSTIVLQYRLYTSEDFSSKIEKDAEDPEIVKVGNTEFYVMTNYGTYCAAWVYGNIEGLIYGLDSHDELIQIIDSINCGG